MKSEPLLELSSPESAPVDVAAPVGATDVPLSPESSSVESGSEVDPVEASSPVDPPPLVGTEEQAANRNSPVEVKRRIVYTSRQSVRQYPTPEEGSGSQEAVSPQGTSSFWSQNEAQQSSPSTQLGICSRVAAKDPGGQDGW